MNIAKKTVQTLLARAGFDITRRVWGGLGRDAYADMKRFVPSTATPVIFDVGANVGQSVARFREHFSSSIIHSFEPDHRNYQKLQATTSGLPGVTTWNLALGREIGRRKFFQNSVSELSSFLELSTAGGGVVDREESVNVTTVDHFLGEQGISFVDVLKSDTQGYDFEVFKGAEKALRDRKIGLIYFEFTFVEMYQGLPAFDELFRHLTERGFILVSIYDFNYRDDVASYADILFVQRDYYRRSHPLQTAFA